MVDSRKVVRGLRRSGVLRLVPKKLKLAVKSHLDFAAINREDWRQTYAEIMKRAYSGEQSTEKEVCIIQDWMLRHAYYEAACRELGVPYHLLDITKSDWVERLTEDSSFIYFMRPFVLSTLGRTVYEERSFFIANVLQRNLFPDFNSLWIYESKRRCANWLEYYNIPHPETRVFFERGDALDFIKSASYPLVFKTDIGSDAVGVRILHSEREARDVVRQCFGKGYKSNFYDPRDRNYGQVFFQRYLRDVREWRIIRIGESFFAYQKGKKGEFHSGSKVVYFCRPSEKLLDFSRNLLDRMGMNCMALDIFEDREDNYFVNELQAYYGANETGGYYYEDGREISLQDGQTVEMMVGGRPGRYYYDGGWHFEEGDFSRNAGCNLRVKLAFQQLGEPLPGWKV